MSLFSCKFYKEYFYFIIYWVLDLLNNMEWGNFINKYNIDYYNTISKDYKLNNKYYFPFALETELYNLLNLILADLSFGFLVAYTYIRMNCKRNLKDENQDKGKTSKNSIELIYNKPSKTKKAFILIILISFLDFVARTIELFFFLFICSEKTEEKQNRWLITFEILPRIIFCRFILKVKLYKHHFLSLLFFFIGFLIISILGIISIDTKNQRIYAFTMIIPKVIYALEDTINKIILTDRFILPHFLLFFRGLINAILVSILICILYFTSSIDFRYYDNILNNIQVSEIIFRIISFIFMACKIFCIFKIIYIFTPQHVGFCLVIIYMLTAIKNMILEGDFQKEFFYCLFIIISLLFIAFGTLIFNEMILINCWGLNENTKSGIIDKEKLENIELKNPVINDDDNDDNDDKDDRKESFSQMVKDQE